MVRFCQKAPISFNFEEKKHLIPTNNQLPFSAKILARLVDRHFCVYQITIKNRGNRFFYDLFTIFERNGLFITALPIIRFSMPVQRGKSS